MYDDPKVKFVSQYENLLFWHSVNQREMMDSQTEMKVLGQQCDARAKAGVSTEGDFHQQAAAIRASFEETARTSGRIRELAIRIRDLALLTQRRNAAIEALFETTPPEVHTAALNETAWLRIEYGLNNPPDGNQQ